MSSMSFDEDASSSQQPTAGGSSSGPLAKWKNRLSTHDKADSRLEIATEGLAMHAAKNSTPLAPLKNTGDLKLDGALKVFAEHPFFAGVRMTCIASLAKYSAKREYGEGGGGDEDVLLYEDQTGMEADSLWVIERGSVLMYEGGEFLGKLQSGTVFGDAVALGRLERQPMTVKLGSDPLVAWCVTQAAVSYSMRNFPEAKQVLEDRMDRQTRSLMVHRASKLLFFSHCGPSFFQQLVPKIRVGHVSRDSVALSDGTKAEGMVMVVRGTVRVLNHLASRESSASVAPYGRRAKSCLQHSLSGVSIATDLESEELSPLRRMTTLPAKALLMAPVGEDEAEGGEQEECDAEVTSSSDETDSDESGDSVVDDFASVQRDTLGGKPETTLAADRHPIVFGESVVLGGQTIWARAVHAVRDCIVLVLPREDFIAAADRHPRERRRFMEMGKAKFREGQGCYLSHLSKIDLFRRCSHAFLQNLAPLAKPTLLFSGDDVVAERGLVLMMFGTAEQTCEDGLAVEAFGPQSFGTLEWLGVPVQTLQTFTAKCLCQILTISRDELLEVLKQFPQESTTMVSQVFQHNGTRMTIAGSRVSTNHKRGSARPVKHLQLWHMPFCRGCCTDFLSSFTQEIKVSKLLPGQTLYVPDQEDSDFLLVAISGSIWKGSAEECERLRTEGSLCSVPAPVVLCGFNKKDRLDILAAEVCEIHRLPLSAIHRLADLYPKDTRTVLQRLVRFEKARQERTGCSLLSVTSALRLAEWFKDSDEFFLQTVAESLSTEVFLPGETLVEEGDAVDSTIFMECGSANIEKADRRLFSAVEHVGNIGDGYWIGEMAMFVGESRRRATVRAATVCKVQRLNNKTFVQYLTRFPVEREKFRALAEKKLLTCDRERLEDLEFFKNFDRAFLNLLRPKCLPQVFFHGEVLMKQGEVANSLYILGSEAIVTMEVDGEKIRSLRGRHLLGTVALLARKMVKRASTVTTQTMCTVRVLRREDWLDALKHHPDHRRWLHTFTQDQMTQVSEARTAFKKKTAWQKISKRNASASESHASRLFRDSGWLADRTSCRTNDTEEEAIQALPVNNRCLSSLPRPSSMRERPASTSAACEDRRPPPNATECWDCFNGEVVEMPSTRLPQLGSIYASLAGQRMGKAANDAGLRTDSRASSVCGYEACEQALLAAA